MTFSICKLPPKIITKIFEYLLQWERRQCSLVCRHFHDALQVQEFHQTMVFKNTKVLRFDEEMLATLQKSYHPFRAVHFKRVERYDVNEHFKAFFAELPSITEVTFTDFKTYTLIRLVVDPVLRLFNVQKLTFDSPNAECTFHSNEILPTVTELSINFDFEAKMIMKVFPNLQILEITSYMTTKLMENLLAFRDIMPKIRLNCLTVMTRDIKYLLTMNNIEILQWELHSKQMQSNVYQYWMEMFKPSIKKLTLPITKEFGLPDYVPINRLTHLTDASLVFEEGPGFLFSVSYIEQLQNLKRLRLTNSDSNVTHFIMPSNAKLPRMESLGIFGYFKRVDLLVDSFPNLREIFVATDIGRNELATIFVKCIKLKKVSLGKLRTPLDKFGDFFKLREIDKLECIPTPLLLKELKLNNLYSLCLATGQIDVEGLKHLGENCPNIRELSLACTNFNDEFIPHLLKTFKKLTSLNVCGTEISQEGYEALQAAVETFVG